MTYNADQDLSLCRKLGCYNKRHITKTGKLRPYCQMHENKASRQSKRKKSNQDKTE